MTYLVMECHPAYALVLDERGRLLRVPNLGYEVGQTLGAVVTFDDGVLAFDAAPRRRRRTRLVALLAAAWPAFPSSLARTVRSTAASALPKCARTEPSAIFAASG